MHSWQSCHLKGVKNLQFTLIFFPKTTRRSIFSSEERNMERVMEWDIQRGFQHHNQIHPNTDINLRHNLRVELFLNSCVSFYSFIILEIACRISPEAMIYSEIYHEWPQAIHGRFHREDPTFEIRRQFRRARGHRATGEIA